MQFNEESFKSALCIYTFVGAVVGGILALTYYVGGFLYSFSIKSLLIVIIYLIVTGGLHLDGAADTCDGVFSGRTGDKVFEIMSDSKMGSFGVLSLIIIVLSQYVLFSKMNIFTCFLMPVIGRACVVVGCYDKKYAKKTKGMGSMFIESIREKELISNLLIMVVLCLLLPYRLVNIIAAVMTVIIAFVISKWLEKKLTGMTGDTCGFLLEVSQIIFMLTVAAFGRI